MNTDKQIISRLSDELEMATNKLNKLGYFECPVCGEFKQLEEEEICSSCQRKLDQKELIRERG